MAPRRKSNAKRRLSETAKTRIRAHILAEGIEFRVFLPSDLADWLRAQVEAGAYLDVKEAAFVAFQELRDLTEHPAIRARLRTAVIRARIDELARNPVELLSIEEVRIRLAARQDEWARTAAPNPRALPVSPQNRTASVLKSRPKSLK